MQNDHISRKTAIKKMFALCGKMGSDYLFIDDIQYELESMDAADAQCVACGEWEERIVEDESPIFRRRFYCSACGGWNINGKSKFCPECGAKMEVRECIERSE